MDGARPLQRKQTRLDAARVSGSGVDAVIVDGGGDLQFTLNADARIMVRYRCGLWRRKLMRRAKPVWFVSRRWMESKVDVVGCR